ncbi:MAG: extracellular solute-binding protein [Clostridiales bacterium]|nr:extracellular solute-binding protein [Clostridiales bacterium]MDD6491518.1 extracellular solute-binding protein [Bacillota bacterium]
MMKKMLCLMLSGIMAVTLLTGCGSGQGSKEEESVSKPQETGKEETADSEKEAVQTVTEPVEIKIWHDGDEAIMANIADTVNQALESKQISVSFEKKSGLTDQLQLYGNDAVNGPDMYFYAHDSLGTFVEMGILSPIKDLVDDSVFEGLLPMTVEAGTYKNTQYFMPVYFETLLFMYNKSLWEGAVPETTEELYAYMETHTDTTAGNYAVVNQHSTAYNVAPIINGFGGYIIDKDGNPGLDTKEMIEAVEYNKKFAALQADGDYNTVTTLFNEGKAAAIVGGPWLISGIKDAGIDLGIKSLADFKLPNGNGLAPFSGVQGVGVMKHAAEGKKDAISQVLVTLAGKEVGEILAISSNCAPANIEAYDNPAVADNEMIVAIKDTAQTAQPMPNIPEMSVMWGPAEGMLAAVNKSGEDVQTATQKYQQDALTAIEDMQ